MMQDDVAFLPSDWLKKPWHHNDVQQCNGIISPLAEGMMRSDDVRMVWNKVMQILPGWLGDWRLIPNLPSHLKGQVNSDIGHWPRHWSSVFPFG